MNLQAGHPDVVRQVVLGLCLVTATLGDEHLPLIAFGPAVAIEGDLLDGSRLRIPVALSKPAVGPVNLGFRTVAGTALPGEDYGEVSGSIVIPEGESSGLVEIPVVGDRVFESQESFAVEFTGVTNVHFDISHWAQLPSLSSLPGASGVSGIEFSGSDLFLVSDVGLGAVRLYRQSPIGEWEDDGVLSVDGEPGDDFGSALAATSEWIVVGAEDAEQTGSTFVFPRPLDGAAPVELRPDELKVGADFGAAVAIDEGTIVVGAPRDAGASNLSGAAYVFVRSEAGWELAKKLVGPDTNASDMFGMEVSVRGDVIAVGAPQWEGTGVTYVYERNAGGDGQWGMVARLTQPDEPFSAFFGRILEVGDGVIAIVGREGGSKVFLHRQVEGSWEYFATVEGDRADRSLGLSGSIVFADEDTLVVPFKPSGTGIANLYTFRIDAGEGTAVLAGKMEPDARLPTSDGTWLAQRDDGLLAMMRIGGFRDAHFFTPALRVDATIIDDDGPADRFRLPLVREGSQVRYRVPTDDAEEAGWRDPDFDDSGWEQASLGIAREEFPYEVPGVSSVIEGGRYGVYLRIPFTVDDPERFAGLTLHTQYSDGFAANLNGNQVASVNMPVPLEWNSRALNSRSRDAIESLAGFDLASHLAGLIEGQNIFTVHLAGRSFEDQFVFAPELSVSVADATYEWWQEVQRRAGHDGDLSPLADPDGDGSVNLLEYGGGSDPGSFTTPAEMVRFGLGGVELTLPVRPPDDLEYLVEFSETLQGPWETLAVRRAGQPGWNWESPVLLLGELRPGFVRFLVPILDEPNRSALFARVRVRLIL